jgi:hypothetical protein
MIKSAIIDPTNQYRYSLLRDWDESLPRVAFVMLNPSTADATLDDPTLRRCLGFAQMWGYGSLELVNLFAYRATNPQELKTAIDPIGPLNNDYLATAVTTAEQTIIAWGNQGRLWNRAEQVLTLLSPRPLYHLGLTSQVQPRHPLYAPKSVNRILWR